MADQGENKAYRISDGIWEQIEPLLPPKLPKIGRPGMDNQKVMEAIMYVFRADCQWKDIPCSLGVPGAIRRRFLEWRKAGVFQRMWQAGLLTYDELRAMFWNGE